MLQKCWHISAISFFYMHIEQWMDFPLEDFMLFMVVEVIKKRFSRNIISKERLWEFVINTYVPSPTERRDWTWTERIFPFLLFSF